MKSVLHISGLTRSFPGHQRPVVDGVGFSVEEGEIFVLLGPSGCGKTTTLRIIGGFETPDAGEVRLGDKALVAPGVFVPPEARGIGFVFQDYALFPHLSVAANIGYGLRQLSRKERAARIDEMLALVGLQELADRMPQQLSGGEQQRIALARSLARRPRVLLLDEPFSNLDEQRRTQMRVELRRLLKAQGTSAVMVTHHQEEAMTMGDRVAIMRDGVLKQVDAPEMLYRAPVSAFVADFLGHTNLFSAEANGDVASTLLGDIPIAPSTQGSVRLSLRPEDISIASADDEAPGRVGTISSRQFFGAVTRYEVSIDDVSLQVLSSGAALFDVGAPVQLQAIEAARVVEPDLPLG